MWSKRFSLLFYLRKPKNTTKGKQLVYMRITIDAARLELSAQRECEPDRWNPRSGRAKGTKEDVWELNAYLDSLQAKVYEAHRSLLDKNEPVTIESLRNKLRGTKTKARMILEVFQHHNDQVEQLVGSEFFAGTLERYKTSLEHTQSFLKWKYQVFDMDIRKLDYEFISEDAFWLKSVRKCSHNTTMKCLANFKKIVLSCIKNGWLQKV